MRRCFLHWPDADTTVHKGEKETKDGFHICRADARCGLCRGPGRHGPHRGRDAGPRPGRRLSGQAGHAGGGLSARWHDGHRQPRAGQGVAAELEAALRRGKPPRRRGPGGHGIRSPAAGRRLHPAGGGHRLRDRPGDEEGGLRPAQEPGARGRAGQGAQPHRGESQRSGQKHPGIPGLGQDAVQHTLRHGGCRGLHASGRRMAAQGHGLPVQPCALQGLRRRPTTPWRGRSRWPCRTR